MMRFVLFLGLLACGQSGFAQAPPNTGAMRTNWARQSQLQSNTNRSQGAGFSYPLRSTSKWLRFEPFAVADDYLAIRSRGTTVRLLPVAVTVKGLGDSVALQQALERQIAAELQEGLVAAWAEATAGNTKTNLLTAALAPVPAGESDLKGVVMDDDGARYVHTLGPGLYFRVYVEADLQATDEVAIRRMATSGAFPYCHALRLVVEVLENEAELTSVLSGQYLNRDGKCVDSAQGLAKLLRQSDFAFHTRYKPGR